MNDLDKLIIKYSLEYETLRTNYYNRLMRYNHLTSLNLMHPDEASYNKMILLAYDRTLTIYIGVINDLNTLDENNTLV